MNIKIQLLRAAILTHRGKSHFAETGNAHLLDTGWRLYHNARQVPGLNGKVSTTSLTTVEEYFVGARRQLASR